MRYRIWLSTIVLFQLALASTWSLTSPRLLTSQEKDGVRGGESEVCYKDDFTDCEVMEGCGDDVLEEGATCPASAWHTSGGSYDTVIDEAVDSTATGSGDPWYESKENGERFQCFQEWQCELITVFGVDQCWRVDDGYVADKPDETAAPYETWTDGLKCLDENASN
ncbi:MAG: hypothetical protein ACK5Q5_04510 [Planctomycetaceae bacterium]